MTHLRIAVAFCALVGTCHGQAIKLVPGRQRVVVLTLGLSRDGSSLVVGGNCVRVYNLKTKVWAHQAESSAIIRAVAFSPVTTDSFVTAGSDGIVRFWHVGDKKPSRELKGNAGHVWGTAFSPDGKLLCTAGSDLENGGYVRGEVLLWNSETGEVIRKLTFPEARASAVNFSKDGKLVAFSKFPQDTEISSSVEIYEISGWKKVANIPFSPGFATSLSFFPDPGQLLVTGGECVPLGKGSCLPTGRIWVIDSAANTSRELEIPQQEQRGYFRSAAVLPSGERFFTSTMAAAEGPVLLGESNLVAQFQMRDAKTGELIWSEEGSRQGTENAATAVSPDGKLVAGCEHGMIVVFDAATGMLTHGIDLGE